MKIHQEVVRSRQCQKSVAVMVLPASNHKLFCTDFIMSLSLFTVDVSVTPYCCPQITNDMLMNMMGINECHYEFCFSSANFPVIASFFDGPLSLCICVAPSNIMSIEINTLDRYQN